jgi:hypothetical protein
MLAYPLKAKSKMCICPSTLVSVGLKLISKKYWKLAGGWNMISK